MKFQVFLDANLPCSNNQEGLIKAIQEHASLSKREIRVGGEEQGGNFATGSLNSFCLSIKLQEEYYLLSVT